MSTAGDLMVRVRPRKNHWQQAASATRIVALLLCVCGCTGPFGERFQGNFELALRGSPIDRACGDFPLITFIPDCPVAEACFTTACLDHDMCYATCGQSRLACDIAFYADMASICLDSLGIDHPDLPGCLNFAAIYWAAVNEYGVGAFAETQELNGCTPGSVFREPGACCTAGSPPTCTDIELSGECAADSVLVPNLTCEEIQTVLGGCPRPINDLCADATPICADQQTSPDLGFCSRGTENELPVRVCSVTSQDCLFGETCLPVTGDAYRCMTDSDNRLASSDGPAAGGNCVASGAASFQADVWFEYTAPCSGTLTIDMCDGTLYDSMLAVYGPNEVSAACVCPTDNMLLLSCNDDFCGGFSSPSGVTALDVIEGGCYLIRVGGWSNDGIEADARRGTGRLDVGVLCETTSGEEARAPRVK